MLQRINISTYFHVNISSTKFTKGLNLNQQWIFTMENVIVNPDLLYAFITVHAFDQSFFLDVILLSVGPSIWRWNLGGLRGSNRFRSCMAVKSPGNMLVFLRYVKSYRYCREEVTNPYFGSQHRYKGCCHGQHDSGWSKDGRNQ